MRSEKIKQTKKNLSFFFLFSFLTFLFSCASNTGVFTPLEIPYDIAGLVHAGHTNSPEEYALIDRMGASWVLTTFYWSGIEPVQDQWNFEWYDRYVDTAKAAGKKVLGVMGYDVSWIHNDGKRHNYIPPDKLQYFLEYVRKTTAHFKGRVDAWCIWNEPNFHFWTGTRNEFFELNRLASDVLREEDPDVILLGGAFNRGIFGLPKAYITGLFESGAMEKADGVAFHPYELNPARTLKLYRSFEKIVSRYGFGDRIWATEVGYPTGGWYPTTIRERKMPEYTIKTFVKLAAEGAKTIFWYQLFDPENRTRLNSEDYFGLVRSRNDYTSKGAEAFRLCAVYLSGTVHRPFPREGLPNSLKTYYFENPEGGGVLVLWKSGLPIRIRALIPGGGLKHDPVSGKMSDILPENIIRVGSLPVFITWNESLSEGNEKIRLQRVR